MKKKNLFLIVCLFPCLLAAQTYSVKVYDTFTGYLVDKEITKENPAIEIPAEEAEKCLEFTNPFFETVLSASSKTSFKKYDEEWGKKDVRKKTFWSEALLEKAADPKSVVLTFKMQRKLFVENREDKEKSFWANDEEVDARAQIRLDAPTVIYSKVEERTVTDQVPFWGSIPLLGRLFQSEGVSRQVNMVWVVVSEVKE